MFKSSRSEKIELCDMCFGDGRLMEDSGNGGMVRTGNPCARCNGTGRILIIETKNVVAFGSDEM
jgi:DnaJ-class molecular chaperone